MSPLNDLLSAIEADANEERARLDESSRAAAEEILARARAEAEFARTQPTRDQEPELQREAARRIGAARVEAANLLREAREESFDQLLGEARSRLGTLRGTGRYRGLLGALLDEARAVLPNARVMRVDPADAELASELAAEHDLTVESSLQTTGGLELASDDGRSIRNTFEERLANAEPELRMAYGRRLAARESPQ
ncbi:MAG: V-type ATP synthase subunit E [Rubrobacteraceae bacterium]